MDGDKKSALVTSLALVSTAQRASVGDAHRPWCSRQWSGDGREACRSLASQSAITCGESGECLRGRPRQHEKLSRSRASRTSNRTASVLIRSSPHQKLQNDVQCVPLRRLPVVVKVPPRGMGRQFASSVLQAAGAARRRAPTQGDGKGPGWTGEAGTQL